MLKRISVLFCVLFTVISCYKYNAPEKPERLISKDEMVNILVDLKLMSSVSGKDKKVLDSANIKTQAYIFNKYNIDSTQFANNNAYYAYNIEDYQDIYSKLKDSLNKLKVLYDGILKEEKRVEKHKKDSIKRLKKEKTKQQKIPSKFDLVDSEDLKDLEEIDIDIE